MSILDRIAQGGNSAPVSSYLQGQQLGNQNRLAQMRLEQMPKELEFKNKLNDLQVQRLQRPDNLFGKVNPQFYTPGSLQKFQGSKNYGDLKMIDGQVIGNNPTSEVMPWSRVPDSAERAKLQSKFALEGQKTLNDFKGKMDSARKMSNDFQRFVALNKDNYTGFGAGALGVRGYLDPDFSEMKSLEDKLTPQMRQGMPGAASDRDVAMFRGAATSTDKPQEANAAIAKGMELHANNLEEEFAFKEQVYLNQGHLIGAEKKWKRYLNDNPIFDPKAKKGSYALNPYRMPWQEYMKASKQLNPKELKELIQLRANQ